eukprot:Rhum_TRINITY_DN9305_c0_g1::Rhum_TRINITY_DN9305_c0_g1_i1::g.32810::m.32810
MHVTASFSGGDVSLELDAVCLSAAALKAAVAQAIPALDAAGFDLEMPAGGPADDAAVRGLEEGACVAVVPSKRAAALAALDAAGLPPDGDGLFAAARDGDTDLCRCFLDAGVAAASVRSAGLFQGWTPLHAASSKGHPSVCALLVEQGGDLEAASHDGWTPLRHAASRGQREACRVLLALGAKADAADTDEGLTPAEVMFHETGLRLEDC